MDHLSEPLEDVDGAGMCEVKCGVLAHRQMCDGMTLFEGKAERLRIRVDWIAGPGSLGSGTSV